MDVKEEIAYREGILNKARKGQRISPEERLWLNTHRIINFSLGYPYLNTDIIQLCPNVDYKIRIQLENVNYPGRIIPIITVPAGKGGIKSDSSLTDYHGNVSTGNTVKMLGLLLDLHNKETEISYYSKLGLLGLSYQCDYWDDKQNLMIRKSSSSCAPHYALVREALSENKVRYCCKSPVSDDYDSLVFTIEWNPRDKGTGLSSPDPARFKP